MALVDPLGNTTSRVLDVANRLIAVVDPLGNRTSIGYDYAEPYYLPPLNIRRPLKNHSAAVFRGQLLGLNCRCRSDVASGVVGARSERSASLAA